MSAWFTFWHVVAVLVLLTVALAYLAYRMGDAAERRGESAWWFAGCWPFLLAIVCFVGALLMAVGRFVWWLL